MTNNKGLIMKLWKPFILLLVVLISIPSYAGTVRYQHTDMLGSVVSESDATGNIINRSHYEPFGKRIGGDKEGIGYTSHLQDKDLGLTYMQARYYDPLIGRFYSNDPIGFRDVYSFNRYAYANNNPYKYTDPTGENPFAIIGGIAGFFQSLSAVSNSDASFTDKALAVAAGTLIGAVTGGRATGAITAVTAKLTGVVGKAVTATASGTVGATSAVVGQNIGDVLTTGQPSSTEDNIKAGVTGFVSGVSGSTSSKDGLNAAMTIVTETVLQTGSALANEEKLPPPEEKEEIR